MSTDPDYLAKRRWRVVGPGPDGTGVTREYSEDDIMRLYWKWWSRRMRELDRQEQITKENCIIDWTTVHWAEEITNV